jgi:hypothetical protein
MNMAWIFSLSAECGSDESNAHKFAEHFEGISWLLSNGRHCKCHTDIFQDIEENTQEAEHLYQIPWFNWPTNDQFIPKNNDDDESNRFRTKANDIQQAIINIFNEQHEPLSQFQQPFRNITCFGK